MIVSDKIRRLITDQEGWTRKMFEAAIQMRKEDGAENVYDFSLGNPDIEPPADLTNKLIDSLFPDNPMRKIPYDHEVFHIYFQFRNGCPHMQGVPHGAYGLFERGTGRLMTISCPGDIHCGWVNRFWSDGRSLEAIKMGINIIIYFLSH